MLTTISTCAEFCPLFLYNAFFMQPIAIKTWPVYLLNVIAWKVTDTRTNINPSNVQKLRQTTVDVIAPSGQFVKKKTNKKTQKGLWQMNCFPSCFTLNSAANRAGLIICVNKRDASLLSFILKSCPSALSPLSPCWLYLTVPPSRRQEMTECFSRAPGVSSLTHRMAQITAGADMRPGRRSVTTTLSTWNSFFSSPVKAGVRHLLAVNVIYPLTVARWWPTWL